VEVPPAASLERVRSLRARADLAELGRSLERYVATTGEVPSSLDGRFGTPDDLAIGDG
jgi:hypothetical protein